MLSVREKIRNRKCGGRISTDLVGSDIHMLGVLVRRGTKQDLHSEATC